MPKKTCYCENCENEFTLITKPKFDGEIKHCPFCGADMEDADCDIGEE